MPLKSHDDALARGLLRYCPVCDGYEVTDRRIGVIGTGERGLQEAEFLRSFTSQIALIAPDGRHDLNASQRERLKAAGVELFDGPCISVQPGSDFIVVATPQGERRSECIYPALGSEIRNDLAFPSRFPFAFRWGRATRVRSPINRRSR